MDSRRKDRKMDSLTRSADERGQTIRTFRQWADFVRLRPDSRDGGPDDCAIVRVRVFSLTSGSWQILEDHRRQLRGSAGHSSQALCVQRRVGRPNGRRWLRLQQELRKSRPIFRSGSCGQCPRFFWTVPDIRFHSRWRNQYSTNMTHLTGLRRHFVGKKCMRARYGMP